MAKPSPAFRLSAERARAARVAAQGLSTGGATSPVDALETAGFGRTLGGVDVYLAVRARCPGMRRADLDEAVEAQRAQVVPAVRGGIYLVSRRDVPPSLRVADHLSRSRAERDREKAGIRDGEIEAVGDAVLDVLGKRGPLTTDALRRGLPEGVVRSLGDAGKKVGISSPLPPALRRLEFDGRIERSLEGGRLDTERYLWRVPEASPFESGILPEDPNDLFARCAEVFFGAAGLGTKRAFAAWAGTSQRDAAAAMERIDLVPVEVEDRGELAFCLDAARGLVEDAPDPSGTVALLPFEDNLIALAGGPALWTRPEHHGVEVPTWGRGKPTTLGEARHMSFRSVLVGDRIEGFWEFDPDSGEIVTGLFGKPKKSVLRAVETASADVASFLADDVGHGRSFSLDKDDDLRKRAARIRDI